MSLTFCMLLFGVILVFFTQTYDSNYSRNQTDDACQNQPPKRIGRFVKEASRHNRSHDYSIENGNHYSDDEIVFGSGRRTGINETIR